MTTTDDPPITTQELRDRLDDPSLTIVDVRPLAAYNGWRLGARGARRPHPRRRRLSRRLARDRRRARDRPTARRQGRPRRSRRSWSTATALRTHAPPGRALERLRHRRRRVYEDGLAAWAADPALPVERLPNYEQARPHRLAPPGPGRRDARGRPDRRLPAVPRQLRRPGGVRGGPPPGRALSRHELARGSGRLEPPLAGGARSRRSAALGITKDTTVIVYGRDTEGDANEKWPGRRAGQIAATRALMILTLRRSRGRPPARRRLRLVGPRRQPGRDGPPRAVAGRRLRRRDPAAAGGHRRHRRGQADHRRPRRARPS